MKIFFIIPPDIHYIEPYAYIQADKSNRIRPHLGLLYVAAELRRSLGITPRIIDLNLGDLTLDELGTFLSKERPDLIGFSVLTFNLLNCIEVCKVIRRSSPDTKICFGGWHPTLYPRETLKLGVADYIVMGEGEDTFCELVRAIGRSNMDQVKGIGYRDENHEIKINAQCDPIKHLDDIAFPAYDLIDIRKYSNLLASSSAAVTMITSRGCPHKCNFCDIRQSVYRYRSPEDVMEEMTSYVDMGIKEIFIQDDNFTLNRSRAKELCRLMIGADLHINYKISSRVDYLDDELISLLKESGCKSIHFGVESGSQRMLDYLQKGITVGQVKSTFELAKKHGIECCAYIMIGIPTETKEDISETLKLIDGIKPRHLQCAVCTPMPKTYLYRKLLEDGSIRSDYWLDFAKNPNPNFRTPFASHCFTDEELRRMQNTIQRTFYFSPRVIFKEAMATRSLNQCLKKLKHALRMLFN